MPGAKITVRSADVDTGLTGYIDRLDNPAPFYASVAELLLNSTRARFLSQSGPDGAPWMPLSKDYLSSANKKGSRFPTAIGRLNGYLFQLIPRSSSQRAEVGSNRVYAAMFQFGGTTFAGQRVGHVRLRTDARGNLLRALDENGNPTNRAVFARSQGKGAHKRYEVRGYATSYYESIMPGRPFLGISAADRAGILAAAEDYITGRP